jgi:tetratricopeptide (TPR) repeat protein
VRAGPDGDGVTGAGPPWDAAASAAALLEPAAPAPEPAGLTAAQRLALCWALKEACHAAWLSDPARAAAAARAVAGVAAWPPRVAEIDAVAAWTGGIADLTRGAMSEAVTGFDRAAAAFAALAQPDRAAQTQLPKVMALSMLGQYDEAARCAAQALQAFTAQGDTASAAKLSHNLGSLHMHRDDYAAAARHYREAAVLFARGGQMQHSVAADIGLADAITAQGDFDAAAHMYARAGLRARHHGLPVLQAIGDESMALLELARGRYQAALAGMERARRGYEALAMPQHLAVAEKQLADAYLELRLLPEAMALYDAALPRFAALEMHAEQAWTLVQRGRALAWLDHTPAAADALREAAGIFTAQGNGVGAAAVALARADLAAAGGDSAGALEASRVAIVGFAHAGHAEAQLRAEVAAAQALLALGRVDEAGAGFDGCLARARALGVLPPQVRALTGLGLVARQRGQAQAAEVAFEAAIALFEDQRQTLAGDDLRQAFLADHLRPYRERLAQALDGVASATADGGGAAAVLRQLERVRARSLGERLAGSAPSDVDPAMPALRGRLDWLYRRLRRAQDDGSPSQALVDELRGTERELLERVRRQRLAVAAGVAGARDEGLDVEALCLAMGPHDALVEFGVSGDELFACVVRPQGVQLVRGLAAWHEVLEAVQSARFQMDTLRHGSAPVVRHLPHLERRAVQRLQRLHALTWAPLHRLLQGCTRVLVVPHGQLAALPFAALHDGNHFLGARVQLALVPSARVALHGLRQDGPPAASGHALVLGESTRLPHAAGEARHVAALFADSLCLVDAQATLDALRRLAPAADVIHLACHAQFRGDNPLFSALHLHDGALTAEWLQGLALRPALVVLSACETGLADQGQGDEMVGLVRAFLVAGAARVLAALWPVDDAVTGRFMAAFYGARLAGSPCAAALQQAQSEVRRTHPHPFYWAGFALQGGW